mmetsp:Transcript_34441/g.53762  ORF Transcript_34441/g.53762 Transcript_34441/m.53762 type:complete len:83 (-) Transcript_34441:844-1092(-)
MLCSSKTFDMTIDVTAPHTPISTLVSHSLRSSNPIPQGLQSSPRSSCYSSKPSPPLPSFANSHLLNTSALQPIRYSAILPKF